MALSDEQTRFYRQTMEMTQQQINDLNGQIEEELAKEIGRASCRERV